MQTIFNVILLILFVVSFAYGIYLLLNWKMLVKSNKQREQEFYDWLDQCEEDLKKEN